MKWSRENYYHNLSSPYCLRLASGDASGKIIVWDVVSGTAHCEIQEHSKPIQGNSPSRRLELIVFCALARHRIETFLCQLCQGESLSCCFVVGYLFSLRCSYCHSLSLLLLHCTICLHLLHNKVSRLCLPLFLCQTWSGCGIRMHLVICC